MILARFAPVFLSERVRSILLEKWSTGTFGSVRFFCCVFQHKKTRGFGMMNRILQITLSQKRCDNVHGFQTRVPIFHFLAENVVHASAFSAFFWPSAFFRTFRLSYGRLPQTPIFVLKKKRNLQFPRFCLERPEIQTVENPTDRP